MPNAISSSSSSTSSSILKTPNPMVPISIKLNDDNFLTCKIQAMGTIKTHRLGKYFSES